MLSPGPSPNSSVTGFSDGFGSPGLKVGLVILKVFPSRADSTVLCIHAIYWHNCCRFFFVSGSTE